MRFCRSGLQIRRLEAARAARVREVELRGCQVDEAAGTVASWLRARSNMSRHASEEFPEITPISLNFSPVNAAIVYGHAKQYAQ